MTIKEAIDVRRSRRKYLTTPISDSAAKRLRTLITEYSQKADLRMELVINDGDAFNGLRKSYGMFTGVGNYIGLIATKNDFACMERLGYYGELLLLNAVAMGLGTCWVGGSFDRASCPFKISEDELIVCTITVGNVEEQDSIKEKLIHRITHRKTKAAEEMFSADDPVPDWFINGMKSVQKAPSAVNRQPVLFTYKKGRLTAGVEKITDIGSVLDLGIAKLHFELGAGRGTWNWGNNSEFSEHKAGGLS